MQKCIDYIKFTNEMEGSTLSEEETKILEEILDEDISANEAINNYIEEMGLNTHYEKVEDESAFYEGTKCLVNYFNIKDREYLKKIELFFGNARTAELFTTELNNSLNFDYLLELHEKFFSDIYPSAGQIRCGVVSRRTEFCQPNFIESMAEEIFGKLAKDNYLRNIEDRDDFINELAYYMGEVEALHPFKDGNGRTARFFFYQLMLEAGYDFAWDEVDPNRMLEANIAAIDGDYQPLIDVLEDCLYIA